VNDITIFASESGEVLAFEVRIDGGTPDLIAQAAICTLVVPENGRSPFALVNSLAIKGRSEYVVLAGDFPAGTYQGCFVRYVGNGAVLRSAAFVIQSRADDGGTPT